MREADNLTIMCGADCIHNVRSSIPNKPIGLHGLFGPHSAPGVDR
jgi:hypothetical protein